ncbi:hypothetical protein RJ55_04338 [Drechmeria coniospora]|nr:hypothetical protein RJ55_04338 [Drechmeria coniospora]
MECLSRPLPRPRCPSFDRRHHASTSAKPASCVQGTTVAESQPSRGIFPVTQARRLGTGRTNSRRVLRYVVFACGEDTTPTLA